MTNETVFSTTYEAADDKIIETSGNDTDLLTLSGQLSFYFLHIFDFYYYYCLSRKYSLRKIN